MQTDLMEGQLHADSRGRKPTRPFTTWVHTAEPCTAYTAVFYDGRPTRIGNSPPGPEFGTGGFDLSEDPGETYDQYLVDPRAIDPVTHRWPRKWQQDTCKPLRAAAQERANHNLLVRRVQDLFVLPEPGLALVPERSGITGLPIRLWAADIPSDVLRFPPTVLEGKRIEIEARPLSFEWDTGDSGTSATQWRYSTPAPGSAEQPAVTHVYETKSSVGRPGEGVYTIKLTVRWARRYRVVGIADPCNNWCDLDPGETSATRAYQVDEVRGALIE